ncbi:MAG: hypothetical protein A3I44_04140 [Candidatus Sungbacteria bacterium RIFCSPLOWO2_02_FULL_51_17]|uniref:Uncharacterized protein n=1 Tax=Candidatus Sungbacteria bacterium RIFCSPHIGHO2_02_FULL_51_29 TaxID=1802273 RepID=A0A1G2KWC8_9BACT|nr:MAG: hypothetical protein A3C16_03690 [Candidatus Sungbacteria bacterium RIFCSPHIGHO2_02_FULL_51_29]OHA05405.1 MAG: hypothetical protein A3B29_02450 [Candidatus Sungbacteria bacterium RIFCSPLOWO2_01_FULL_51_34]OHA11270.1 MAG: hypothetical protein A3I44_04140 [Candidatus Sungbacteria bacterium RIFCSPLOWO2_02_FULL_51_17]
MPTINVPKRTMTLREQAMPRAEIAHTRRMFGGRCRQKRRNPPMKRANESSMATHLLMLEAWLLYTARIKSQ